MESVGLYIHVPFCARKCFYCDFYSIPYRVDVAKMYVTALIRQLRSFPRRRIDTVYWGGGTPSLLPAREITRVMEAVAEHMTLERGAEITLELNPETADPDVFSDLRQAGINRLSVGLQSADDEMLRRIGRRHTAAQAVKAVQQAAAIGIENISIDVMLALPGQTTDQLEKTLAMAGDLPVSHVSAYLLKLADDTFFGQYPPVGLPGDDAQAELYEQCVKQLGAQGFRQYEISNFARRGWESRHNLKYWSCQPYLGLGPGAHSCIDGRRYRFAPDLAAYLDTYAKESVAPLGERPLIPEGVVSAEDAIMLGLRLAEGINLEEINESYHYIFNKQSVLFIETCARQGLLFFDGQTVRLSTRGMLVSNAIISGILWPQGS